MATAINAMKPVAAQPRAKSPRGSRNSPGDDAAPAQDHDQRHDRHRDQAVDDRAPEQRLDRIDGDGVEADADNHRRGDDAVEGLGFKRFTRQPGRPVQGAADAEGGGAGQHRHAEHPGADDARREGEIPAIGRSADAAAAEFWMSSLPAACNVAAVVMTDQRRMTCAERWKGGSS